MKTIGVLGGLGPQATMDFEVMEGRENADSASAARRAVDEVRARSVDGIVLGCTEIPLLLGDEATAPDLVNPLDLLAHAAVNHALQP